ncbi:MAG: hypothetical protein EBR30_14535 [Cytophagia bacterium]|nr:hypothetical protein [Cytophagia bacterium]NBW36207.1 hypothetical protein [Cytophagia bacterium]
MRKLIIIFTILLVPTITIGQKKRVAFNMKDFNEKFDLVLWLSEYDAIAWLSSDSVMVQDQNELKKLGPEWFCFKDSDGIWHAAYGRLNEDLYDLVFHFKVDKEYRVIKSSEMIDSSLLNSHAKALRTVNNKLKQLKDSVNISFNQFIRQNRNKTFDIWILPAFQTNGVAVYGGEFHYIVDQTGGNIISQDSYYQGVFRGFKADPPREIWLNYRDKIDPTLGSIFFAWYYKKYFTSIKIDNKDYFSTPFKDGENYTWLHVQKEKTNEKRKK